MKRKGEDGTDAGSESRSKIYFDYAEQQGGKDDKVGLNRQTYIHPYPTTWYSPCRGRVSYNRKTGNHHRASRPPNVAMEIAPLRGHRSTSSASSEDPLRPLRQVERVGRSKHKKRQCIICTDGTLSFIILITSC